MHKYTSLPSMHAWTQGAKDAKQRETYEKPL
jgi:hypothetical protein